MAGRHDVYISHSPPDRETAEMLGFFLRGEGLRCATSACGAPAAAGSARLLLLVFSKQANASACVQEEVALAAAANLPILLFRTEDAPPAGRLGELLEGALLINAVGGLSVTHVPDVVHQAAKALGRDLPGACGGDWRRQSWERRAYLKITVHPPGAHVRATWPLPVAEGPSPLYMTATASRVAVEATMEGCEPGAWELDIDADSSAMDCCLGLRSLATAQAAREKEAAAKRNDSANSVGEVSGEPAERRRQWDLLDVAWRRALEDAFCDVYIGARPGQACAVGRITVVPRSDTCRVMNAGMYDPLMRLYETRFRPGVAAMPRNRRSRAPHFLPGFLEEAIETLRAGLLGEGSGPVAPCFDECDEAAEAARGKWYVFDGDAYSSFDKVIRPLLPCGRRSVQG